MPLLPSGTGRNGARCSRVKSMTRLAPRVFRSPRCREPSRRLALAHADVEQLSAVHGAVKERSGLTPVEGHSRVTAPTPCRMRERHMFE